jgi:hypothetical protein
VNEPFQSIDSRHVVGHNAKLCSLTYFQRNPIVSVSTVGPDERGRALIKLSFCRIDGTALYSVVDSPIPYGSNCRRANFNVDLGKWGGLRSHSLVCIHRHNQSTTWCSVFQLSNAVAVMRQFERVFVVYETHQRCGRDRVWNNNL